MSDSPVLVTGATGFIGGRLARRLVDAGVPVRAMARSASAAIAPGAELVIGDLTDRTSLEAACAGVSAVISCAAITGDKKAPPGGYDVVNADGIGALAEAATAAGVGRLIHFGGIDTAGAKPGPYLTGRRRGEERIKAAGVPWTILQPSVQFGPGSPFIRAMAGLVKAPVAPVAGSGRTRIQMIHVDDVCRAAQDCLTGDGRLGRYVELGGPEAVEYDRVLDIIGGAMGKAKVRKLHAPLALVRLQATLLQVLPNPPVTPAAVELLEKDNVAASLDVVEREFGFQPVGFAAHVASHGLEL
ncbi:MAG: NAD-dependent epimerase/dehydratase family protein [Actinobacteria bacterium]|nr:NAD-dependent epimerase/dehydratase family protein [Actinomycetota bacterium]